MHPSRLEPACLLLLTLLACETPADPFDLSKSEGEGLLGEWVHSGFYDRRYYLHTPPDMTDSGDHPLLILLHGAGDTGRSFHARLAADAITDAAGFIAVYPDGLEGTWTVGCGGCTPAEGLGANDVTFLSTLVRHLARGLPVDTTRIFVGGYSQGGQLAQLFGCRSALPPAGVGSVAALIFRSVASDCQPGARFPVVVIHGDADPVMAWDGYGGGANVASLPETVDVWAAAMDCDPEPHSEERHDEVGDGTSVTLLQYRGCEARSAVTAFRINGGGHTWPGKTGPWPLFAGRHSRNLDGTAEMVALFHATESLARGME